MSPTLTMTARHRILDTPTGPFAIRRDADGGLRTGWIHGGDDDFLAGSAPDPDLEPDLARRLARYFDGADVDFADVPSPTNGGGFFERCWAACRTIPRGETRTYGELAVMAGSTAGAARAAGQAMRSNPLPIVVPCHRVRSSTGLGGFSGSDDPAGPTVDVKRRLLALEGADVRG